MGATADAAKATSASSPSAVVVGVSWEAPRPHFRVSSCSIVCNHRYLARVSQVLVSFNGTQRLA